MGAPNLPDLETLWQAGINPRTGLPVKLGSPKCLLKEELKKQLRIKDEQNAINRYVWYNLPANITSQELERLLYYKGQLCFFYCKDLDEFYFMPYALDGSIDFYQRFNTVHPVPISSGTDGDKNGKAQAQYLANLKLKCIYGIDLTGEVDPLNSTVLLHDYSKQLSQTIIPRVSIQEPLLDMMAEIPAMMRTNLIASSGVKGVRVQDADQQQNVADGSRSLINASLTGDPWVPIIGNIEFQELTDGQVGKSQDYLLTYQALDNLRLGLYGIDAGGVYEKKAQELQAEANINQAPSWLIMQDGLSIRQNFCNVVNSI